MQNNKVRTSSIFKTWDLLLLLSVSLPESMRAPVVGVSASWLSLIQDREGRLICIADSCATIGYILPHPEPRTNKWINNNGTRKTKERKTTTKSEPKWKIEMLNTLSESSANLWFSNNDQSTSVNSWRTLNWPVVFVYKLLFLYNI